MSTRVFKKLFGDNSELEPVKSDDDEGLVNNERAKRDGNAFNLLMNESDDEDTDESKSHDEEVFTATKKRRRVRKKKNKINKRQKDNQQEEKQEGKKVNHAIDEEAPHCSKSIKMRDAEMKNIESGTTKATASDTDTDTATTSTAAATGRKKTEVFDMSVLSVQLKHLNPNNEIMRTFGKDATEASSNRRNRNKQYVKNTHLVIPKDTWPPIPKNAMVMNVIGTGSVVLESKKKWFVFEHSQEYQELQILFMNDVHNADLDFMFNMISEHPYHIDSILQLNELYKVNEEYLQATDLIQRAVYAMESYLHPLFSLTNGHCHLDYRYRENRPFFLVLYKYAQCLDSRACTRTAFEVAKLLYNLNPFMDPLAMILVMDYYAIRSKQYNWLIDFFEEQNVKRNLAQLPNMSYSYALALYLHDGECVKTDKCLQYALIMFPGVLFPLLDKLSLKIDESVMKHSYFHCNISNTIPSLHQMQCLYICRSKAIWNQSNILPWIEKNAKAVIELANADNPFIRDCAMKGFRYGPPPRPVLRHVLLSDFNQEVPLSRFLSLEDEPILVFDPLPPRDSINYSKLKRGINNDANKGISPATLQQIAPILSRNASITSFFQSLMPSFNLGIINLPTPGVTMLENNAALNYHPANIVEIEDIVDDDVDDNNSPNQLAIYNGDLDIELDNLHEIEAISRDLNEIAALVNLHGDADSADNNESLRDMVETMRNFVEDIRFMQRYQYGQDADMEGEERRADHANDNRNGGYDNNDDDMGGNICD